MMNGNNVRSLEGGVCNESSVDEQSMKKLPFFKLFPDALEKFNRLSSADFGEAVRALLAYIRDGVEPEEISPAAGIAFDILKSQADRDALAYNEKIRAKSENGKKGGRPRKTQQNPWVFEKPNKTQQNPWVIE